MSQPRLLALHESVTFEVELLPALFPPQAGIELSWFPSGSDQAWRI